MNREVKHSITEVARVDLDFGTGAQPIEQRARQVQRTDRSAVFPKAFPSKNSKGSVSSVNINRKMDDRKIADADGGYDGGRGSPGANNDRHDVCRDFLKNVCSRGARCKFYHPPDIEKEQQKDEFNFCIDFQNRGCRREGCRYIHATRDDVEKYKRAGEVTHSLACAIAAVTFKDSINGIPFCKEYKLGKCTRGHRCRYWHVDPDAERDRRMRGGGGGAGGPPPPEPWPQQQQRARGGGAPQGMRGGGGPQGYAPQPPAPTPYGHSPGGMGGDPMSGGPMVGRKRSRYDDDAYTLDIERQNGELRKENDSLKRELARERERYEDLYALFRQHQAGQVQVAASQAAAANQNAAVAAASAQQQQQPPPGPTGMPPPTAPQPVGVPISAPNLISSLAAASMQQASYPQQSMAASNPNDVAVHWSTLQMR